jgi:hypothetical protein
MLKHTLALFIYILVLNGCGAVATQTTSAKLIELNNFDPNLECPENSKMQTNYEDETDILYFYCVEPKETGKTVLHGSFKGFNAKKQTQKDGKSSTYFVGNLVLLGSFFHGFTSSEWIYWNDNGSLLKWVNFDFGGKKSGWLLETDTEGNWLLTLCQNDFISKYRLFFNKNIELEDVYHYNEPDENGKQELLYAIERKFLSNVFITENEGFLKYMLEQLKPEKY